MRHIIALVGCGAIAREFYLPALARRRGEFAEFWLVDPSDRALAASSKVLEGRVAHSLSEVQDDIALAVIAAPNKFHYQLAQEALARGAHVLLEKPFVIWPEDGKQLIAIAAKEGKVLACNQTRRFAPSARDLRRRVHSGEFGALKSVIHYEGHKLSWPFESGVGFQRGAERTGVIMDLGVHVIDFYEYLLSPKWSIISAEHDGFDGPEGLAEIQLVADGAPISLRLSRYQKQANLARLSFERADIGLDVDGLNRYVIRYRSGSISHVAASPPVASYSALAAEVLQDFLVAAAAGTMPTCSAAASLPVIEILDSIYNSAKRYPSAVGAV